MRSLGSYNWTLLLSVLLLMGMGLLALWAYVPPDPDSAFASTKFGKQVIFAMAALALLAAGLVLHYYTLRHVAWPLYGLCLIGLLGVLLFGRVVNGARSWFEVGQFRVQPAEFMKLGYVLVMARYLMYARSIGTWGGLLVPLLLTAVPTLLILLQPDLGSAILFFPTVLTMLFVAGARPKPLLTLVAIALVAAPLAYRFGLKEYQRNRLISFLTPEAVPKEFSHQQRQSVRAVSVGGWEGMGIGESRRTYNVLRVPERHTDFIFSIIGQDLGFLGASFLLFLFILFFWHALGTAYVSREPFGRLVAVGLVTIMASQVLINVGMTLGVAPITGLTLPFLSYGGSSLLTCALSAALLLNIGARWVPTFGGSQTRSGFVHLREFDPGRKFHI